MTVENTVVEDEKKTQDITERSKDTKKRRKHRRPKRGIYPVSNTQFGGYTATFNFPQINYSTH